MVLGVGYLDIFSVGHLYLLSTCISSGCTEECLKRVVKFCSINEAVI